MKTFLTVTVSALAPLAKGLGYRVTIAALLVFFLGAVERKKPVAVVAVSIGSAIAGQRSKRDPAIGRPTM